MSERTPELAEVILDPYAELSPGEPLREVVDIVVAAERERCAEVCKAYAALPDDNAIGELARSIANYLAAAILDRES